jgi:hypothetical protein
VKVISLDCETNGLGGTPFAVAAILTDDTGTEVEQLTMRCPIDGPVEPWVEENVLPALADMPINVRNYAGVLDVWLAWYRPLRDDTTVIGHVVWPVETTFLRTAHSENLFDGPYPLIDVAYRSPRCSSRSRPSWLSGKAPTRPRCGSDRSTSATRRRRGRRWRAYPAPPSSSSPTRSSTATTP